MRELAIALLDDSHGIHNRAWPLLRDLMIEDGKCNDIINSVKFVENRVFLPEQWEDEIETSNE